MNDKHKIVTIIIALICNFTFLATAQNNPYGPTAEAMKLPECIHSHGTDSLATRHNMAYFQEGWKAKDYKSTYACWTYVFNHAPCAYKSIYQIGPQLLNALIEAPENSGRKKDLTDTLFLIFPTRIKYFGEEPFVKGSWAYYMGRHKPEQYSEILNLYAFYIDNYRGKADDRYIKDYMRNAVNAHNAGQYSREQLLSLYVRLSDTAEVYKKRTIGDSTDYKYWNIASVSLDKQVAPYLDCREIDRIYQPQLKAAPQDKVLLKKAIRLYRAAGCTKTADFIALLEKDFALEPGAEKAENLGAYFEQEKNRAKANQYYEKAAELNTDRSKKETLYLKLMDLNTDADFQLASKYMQRVLDINPNSGRAMIFQGIITYKNKCGNRFDESMAACVATDLFTRAKMLDPNCSPEANKQIAIYREYFPLKAEVVSRNLKEGDSYKISCSGITTSIKTR